MMKVDVEDIVDDMRARDLLSTVKTFALSHQVTMRELLGSSHERAPTWARHALWAHLYSLGHWSYPRIGVLFRRHHTTVMFGIKEHNKRAGIAA